ncbi:MAG: BTAD domain-containing putative transcriptional regulator, partial [Rubrobacter sp.]
MAREPPIRELVRIELLGGFRVSVGTRIIREKAWRLRKAAGLVKLLALEPGHRLQRDQAMEALWPNLGPKAATNNLYQALYVARRTLGLGPRSLTLHDGRLALCPEGPLRVDAEIFEEAAQTARRSREPAAYRAALDLYAGDLLPGDRYERWVENRREELRSLYVALLIELARLYEDRGEGGRAIEAFERAVIVEPTREEAHLGMMRLYAAGGQSLRAIVQYERLQTILRSEVSGEPDNAARLLYHDILSGRLLPPSPPMPAEDAGPRRHNLPSERSSFVGRERELAQIKRTLPMSGLLTLTGAGGCGKTRLALQAARDLEGLYPDGAWLVELALLSERTLVAQAFAGVLGVRERPGHSLTEALVDHLRTKNLLLILDNCEHLVGEVAALVDALLDTCPKLRILATSREALRVPGEVVWLLQPLSVPDVDRSTANEDFSGYESVRLFVERAQQRLPAFSLTSENAWSVAEICRKLDGIPLAIELATARTATLAVEQLAERMDDSLELLTVGNRTVEPRRRTLRAALDWSHEPLSKPERTLFRRLSVFAGGFSLEAAEAVGAVGNVGRGSDALDLLSQLVEKSLVSVEEGRRYRLLEPVRLYAQERLEESSEAQDARTRHAEHYLAFAEEADLVGPDQAEWLERLEVELANLRAALSWFFAGGYVERGTRLAAALGARFWNMSGPSEGKTWLECGLDGGVELPAALRARALNELGFIAMCLADYPRMTEAFEEGLALSRELGDERGIAMSLGPLRFAALHAKNHERLSALNLDAKAGYREVVDPWARG